jgi:MoaA/NifB/PqqE/SkfB family radical SAM enzyme
MDVDKSIVKIRREQNHYLAYFIELRKIVPTNFVGARIIEHFFNAKKSIDEVLKILKKSGYDLNRERIVAFLKDLKKDLKNVDEGGYPVVEEEKMEVPLAVELQLNTNCNLRCKHCCQPAYNKIMATNKVKSILSTLYKAKVFELNLVGGELFLHPDIEEIIELSCSKYNFSTTLITNGTLLNARLIKKLSKHKKNIAFLISLEGVGEINDHIRGKGVFNKVDKVLKMLKKVGFYIEISSTINNFNIDHYQKLIDYSNSLGIPLNFNLFKPFKENQDDLTLPPEKYFNFVTNIFKQKLSKNLDIGLTNAAIAAKMFNRPARNECKATLSGLTVDVERRMIPCPFLSEIGYYDDKELPEFSKDFLREWRGNKYFKEFRRGNMRECQACSYIFEGNLNKKSPYGISAFKKYMKSGF